MTNRPGATHVPRSLTAPLRTLAHQGPVLLALATALVAALTATMLRPSTSEAASTPPPPHTAQVAAASNDVTWAPADDISWEYLPEKDQCITTQSATVTTSTPDQATKLIEALQSEEPKTDFPPESGVLNVHVNVSDTANGPETGSTTVNLVLHSYIAKKQCEAAVDPAPGVTATPDGLAPADTSQPRSGRFGTTATGGTFGTTATWYMGALAGLYAGVVYAGMSAFAAGTIVFLAGAAGTTVSAVLVGAAAGCLGGAVAGALTTLMFNADDVEVQRTLSNAVGGCVLGAFAAIPVQAIGTGVAEGLLNTFGRGASALVGDASVGAATSAGVEMTGLSQVVTTTTTVLRASS